MHFQLKTPVAFIIFNRPDTTSQVFEEIRKAKPPLLLVVADGPREGHPDDSQQCARARAVIENVDWKCEVRNNYSEVNLGCKRRVSSGLEWVFRQVPEAIILEDDCLPDPTFFPYCEELLERYRHDERVGQISGSNFQSGHKRTGFSYYFSRYYQAWGWASWGRAWKNYDVDMKAWPEIRKGGWLRDILGGWQYVAYWTYVLDMTYWGELDTWDYQWMFHCWLQSRLAVLPDVNLVSNIGFDSRATHMTGCSWSKDMRRGAMAFPLLHPPLILRNTAADRYEEVHRHLIPFPLLNTVQYSMRNAFRGADRKTDGLRPRRASLIDHD